MGADEAGTLTMLRTLRKEVVKLMCDGLLAKVASVADAVTASVKF